MTDENVEHLRDWLSASLQFSGATAHCRTTLADELQISRLKSMFVLLPAVEDDQSYTELSAKFVRTWCDKVRNGKRVWLRKKPICSKRIRFCDVTDTAA